MGIRVLLVTVYFESGIISVEVKEFLRLDKLKHYCISENDIPNLSAKAK